MQWVHEEDAAAACVFTVLHDGPLPEALNVVAPEVVLSRATLRAFPATEFGHHAGRGPKEGILPCTDRPWLFIPSAGPASVGPKLGAVTDDGVWKDRTVR